MIKSGVMLSFVDKLQDYLTLFGKFIVIVGSVHGGSIPILVVCYHLIQNLQLDFTVITFRTNNFSSETIFFIQANKQVYHLSAKIVIPESNKLVYQMMVILIVFYRIVLYHV